MTCPACGHKNPSSERLCRQCGASLVGEPKFNRGCFIPMILIASVFVMSAGLLLVIDVLDRHGPQLIKPAPLERPTPVRVPTTRTTSPTTASMERVSPSSK